MIEFYRIWAKPNIIGANNFPMIARITNACAKEKETFKLEDIQMVGEKWMEWTSEGVLVYHLRRSKRFPGFLTMDFENDANVDFCLSINAAIGWYRRIWSLA